MTTRTKLWIGFALSVVCFCGSVVGMALRIADFNRDADFARFNARLIADREFHLPGFPPVRLTDARAESAEAASSDPATASGGVQGADAGAWGSFLRLEYGERELMIPVRSPPIENAPNLAVYDEWVKVMAITEMHRSEETGYSEPVESGRRLLIATRTTPPGYDPRSWGSVRRSEWVFTFYNLHPDGTISTERRRWPRKRRGEQMLQRLASEAEERPDEENERYAELALIPPLSERSVEFFAAMHVIPKLNVPGYKFNDTAFSFAVLGWTAPAAGFSVLGMLGTLIFAIAPGVKRPPEPPTPAAR